MSTATADKPSSHPSSSQHILTETNSHTFPSMLQTEHSQLSKMSSKAWGYWKHTKGFCRAAPNWHTGWMYGKRLTMHTLLRGQQLLWTGFTPPFIIFALHFSSFFKSMFRGLMCGKKCQSTEASMHIPCLKSRVKGKHQCKTTCKRWVK